jgi:6-phospho-beta-glucosidase
MLMATEVLDVERKDVTMDLVGLNHLVWGRDAVCQGKRNGEK